MLFCYLLYRLVQWNRSNHTSQTCHFHNINLTSMLLLAHSPLYVNRQPCLRYLLPVHKVTQYPILHTYLCCWLTRRVIIAIARLLVKVPGGFVRAGAGLRGARVGRTTAARPAGDVRRAPRRHHCHRMAGLAARLPFYQVHGAIPCYRYTWPYPAGWGRPHPCFITITEPHAVRVTACIL